MVWVVLLSDFIAGVKGVFAVTITQLQYFKAIAAHENISCAAQELFISQSSPFHEPEKAGGRVVTAAV